MKNSLRKITGSICAPRGFKAAAVFCDIKRIGTGKGSEKGQKRDLALIVSDVPAAVAGMFTTNQVCAAPVKISAKCAARKIARAIVVNSGNANACTGTRGMADAKLMTEITAEAVAALIERRYKISAIEVLVCSTGRIGVPMPMRNVERGIRACAPLIARSPSNARQAAEAIMTSDTRRKEIAVEFELDGVPVRLGGICKGAGMIQPVMMPHATMLAFITTDAAIKADILKDALECAVAQSFNRISIDGDMSTNDSVIMLANGLAENRKLEIRNSKQFRIFQTALDHVCLELAKMIVRDGEGVSRFITLRVSGARSPRDAEAVARAISTSVLVKTSWHGGDPNWGRILCAIGYANTKVNESKIDIGYSRPNQREIVFCFHRGKPTKVAFTTLTAITAQPEFDVHINLRTGKHATIFYTCDLSEDYVAFNKGDTNDPASLGG